MDSKVEVDVSGSDAEEDATSALNDSLTISTISEQPGPRTERRNRRAALLAAELRQQGLRPTSSRDDSTSTTFDVDALMGAMSTALSGILPSNKLDQFQDSMIQALKANLSKQESSRHQSYKFPRQMTTPYSKSRMASRAFKPTGSEAKTPGAYSFQDVPDERIPFPNNNMMIHCPHATHPGYNYSCTLEDIKP